MPLAPKDAPIGVMLPNANGAVVTVLGADVGGPRAGDDQLHRRRGEYSGRLQGRAARHHRHLARLHREGASSTNLVAAHRARRSRSSISRTSAPPSSLADKIRGLLNADKPLVDAQGRRLGRDPVHLGLRRRAEGRRALPPQHAGECRPGCRAHRLRPRGQGVQRAAGVPLVRAHGRRGAAARLRRAHLSLSVAAALPHRGGADLRRERHHHVRHRHVPRRLCARRASL